MARNDEEASERGAAAADVRARLSGRGIALNGAESAGDLAELLSAVERFEKVVAAHGGDLMVDDLKSSRPDDRHFVLPRREGSEAVRAYIARIDEAAAGLRHHPRRPE